MPAVNWCAHFGDCAEKNDLDMDNVKSYFVNPFRKQCSNNSYTIIHNKCPETRGRIYVVLKNETIEYTLLPSKRHHKKAH